MLETALLIIACPLIFLIGGWLAGRVPYTH